MESFYKSFYSIINSVELCIENKHILPALMLIYSAIDIVGSLERKNDEGTKASFIRFVDGYLLKAKALGCTALELYGARCGILHAAAAESDLYKKGEVRLVIYAWGTGKTEDLQKASEYLNRTDCVAIHVSDLVEAFRFGLVSFLDEIYSDEDRRKMVEESAGRIFSSLNITTVNKFLEEIKELR